MTRFTFVTWDGGGNLHQPSASPRSWRRGGTKPDSWATFRSKLRSKLAAWRSRPYPVVEPFDLCSERAPDQRLPAIIRNVWACPEHLEDVPDALAAHHADVLVVDFLMQGALAQARRTDIPAAVLAPSSVAGLVPPPDSPMGSARLAAC